MKGFLRKQLILIIVFLVAAVAIFVLLKNPEQAEDEYAVMEASTLPVVRMTVGGRQVNPLYGYVRQMNFGEAMESLTPLPEDRRLSMEIDTSGDTLTSISYEIRSIDGTNLIEKGDLDTWTSAGNTVNAVLAVKDLIRESREYGLTIILSTEKISGIYYYTRIVRNTNIKAQEMMDYVAGFHEGEFDASKAEAYAINWEVDGTSDTNTLAYVDIHSEFNQLTWGDLNPSQVGKAQITILEMDDTFGYFRVRFEVTAEDEEQRFGTYFAEETLCLQWSQTRFYLMSYERHVEQELEPSYCINGGHLEFGIIEKDRVKITRSADDNISAIVQSGELWTYDKKKNELVKLFTFREGERSAIRLQKDYGIRVMDVTEDGNVEFFVYGYMARGKHEGENGLSYFVYSKEENSLKELLFIPTSTSYNLLKYDLDQLAVKRSKQFYFLMDDTIYALDEDGKEIIRILSDAEAHSFTANADQTAMAWTQGGTGTSATQVQILYLDTGTTRTQFCEEGEYIIPEGFIDQDFVASVGRVEEIGPQGLVTIYPRYALLVTSTDGSESGRYQHEGIYITDVEVSDGQIALTRMLKGESGFEPLETDVLMQNDRVVPADESLLAGVTKETRRRIYRMEVEEDQRDVPKLSAPQQLSYGEELTEKTVERTGVRFYAYVGGLLTEVYDRAGDAIADVYDRMGIVTDSNGYRIWHRTAKYPDKVLIEIGTEVQVASEADRLAGCIDGILRNEDLILDVRSELAAGKSTQQILTENLSGTVVDLEGCEMKQAYIFLSRGTLLLALDEKDKPYLLVGYDLYNVIAYDPVKGSTYKIGKQDAQDLFDKGGNRFLGYVN